ncbi:response regulator transcription factor [Deinococcus radiophilus]|uniref:Response regulator transcription factor n=1 Tax=Deinococcus radiophilus TaxID=32062 RepID=A0A3S0L2Z1_9DEIO|nr:response regulator transcription factor [Deinococcus radiophilus]RTR25731.1 response regulator transcription factor [Deinococcus radiophilus]UFA50196.1 response regulator transcription factor [Deinococcus radiophilus]
MLPQLLLVEDDPHLGPLLRDYLDADYQVYHAATLRSAEDWLGTHAPQLILLDLNLPDGDGLDLVERLRQYSSTPVLVLSARSDVQQRVAGLNAGADDYLTKPFAMPELEARITALLRRTASGGGVNLGNTSLSTSSLTMTIGEQHINLTEHEARILELMMRTPERVFSRADIESHLYGWETPSSNSVEVRISQLRKKLDGAGSDLRIRTIRNVGYVLQS